MLYKNHHKNMTIDQRQCEKSRKTTEFRGENDVQNTNFVIK